MMRLSLLLLMFTPLWGAGDPNQKACCKKADEPAQSKSVTGMRIPNISVLNENGDNLRLKSDLIHKDLVIISFIFTTCTTICPPIGANMAQLEKALAARSGPSVRLLSISVDPVIDTPARLKNWKAQFGGGPGWTLLTGAKTDIDKALKTMQFFVADKTQHSPFLLLGNPQTGQWRRVDGFLGAERIITVLDDLQAAPHSNHNKPAVAEKTTPE